MDGIDQIHDEKQIIAKKRMEWPSELLLFSFDVYQDITKHVRFRVKLENTLVIRYY